MKLLALAVVAVLAAIVFRRMNHDAFEPLPNVDWLGWLLE